MTLQRERISALSACELSGNSGLRPYSQHTWTGLALPIFLHHQQIVEGLAREGLLVIAGEGNTARAQITQQGREKLNRYRAEQEY